MHRGGPYPPPTEGSVLAQRGRIDEVQLLHMERTSLINQSARGGVIAPEASRPTYPVDRSGTPPMRRVLLAAYYVPPYADISGTRVTKFAKYLPANGWQPTVFTVDPHYYGSRRLDRTSEEFRTLDVIRLPYLSIPGSTLLAKLVFPAAVCWVAWRRRRQIDAVYLVGSPFHPFVISPVLTHLVGLPTILDFRDSWSINPLFLRKYRGLSRKLITWVRGGIEGLGVAHASAVTFATDRLRQDYARLFPRHQHRFHTIDNGFDAEDVEGTTPERITSGRTLVLAGKFHFYTPNLTLLLLEALRQLPHLHLLYIGSEAAIFHALGNAAGIQKQLTAMSFQPPKRVLGLIAGADWALLSHANDYAMGTKVYDYLALGKPILAFVPNDSPVNELDTLPTVLVEHPPYTNRQVQNALSRLINLSIAPVADDVDRFSRAAATKRLAHVLDAITDCQNTDGERAATPRRLRLEFDRASNPNLAAGTEPRASAMMQARVQVAADGPAVSVAPMGPQIDVPSLHSVWLPYVETASGTDIYTDLMATGLARAGHRVVRQPLAHRLQYAPSSLTQIRPPAGTTVTLANSWNGFAFRSHSRRLVVVEHLFLFDAALRHSKSIPQSLFHELLVRRWEMRSMSAADAVVAVSHYTAGQMRRVLGLDRVHVIHNGVDLAFFCPRPTDANPSRNGKFQLLFVGNPTRRKGADLLPQIMELLGEGYELEYTAGRGDEGPRLTGANLRCLGRLDREQVRDAYRRADLVLFPSRLEGFGYAPVEAMACGTPAVVTRGSSLVELIADGITGRLCPAGDASAFAAAVRELSADRQRLHAMGKAARRWVEERFSLELMTRRYLELFAAIEDGADARTGSDYH